MISFTLQFEKLAEFKTPPGVGKSFCHQFALDANDSGILMENFKELGWERGKFWHSRGLDIGAFIMIWHGRPQAAIAMH
jgi:hypothetical protein